jgi:glycerophosphoryl diester phosphodiesterase
VSSNRVQVSAHAGHPPHAPVLPAGAYLDALAAGADYVEVDVRRTADGQLVAHHDPLAGQRHPVAAVSYARLCELAGCEVPRVAEVLALVSGRARGHLDLKETGYEPDLVRLALDVLGPGQFVITTTEDASVAAVRAAFGDAAAVPAALSLGRGLRGAPRGEWLRTRVSEVRPLARLRACGADWVAVDHRLAAAGVARRCRRHGLKVMVWTVNNEREMRYWLAGGRADVLVTDRPGLAVAIRDRAAPAPG